MRAPALLRLQEATRRLEGLTLAQAEELARCLDDREKALRELDRSGWRELVPVWQAGALALQRLRAEQAELRGWARNCGVERGDSWGGHIDTAG